MGLISHISWLIKDPIRLYKVYTNKRNKIKTSFFRGVEYKQMNIDISFLESMVLSYALSLNWHQQKAEVSGWAHSHCCGPMVATSKRTTQSYKEHVW